MKKWISFLLVILLILLVGAVVVYCFYLSPAAREPTPTAVISESLPSGEEQSWSYIVNKRSHIFHFPTCPSTDQMAQYNKLFSDKSRDELVAEGFKPCGSCNP